jgi:hypothetical protein
MEMSTWAFRWLWAGLLAISALVSPPLATAACPELRSAQQHLVAVSKIARAFRDGIDRVYIDYARAGFKSRIDDLAARRVFAMQSFLTNHLEAVHRYAWLAFEFLGASSPLASRRSDLLLAAYLTTRVAADLDLIEHYEYHNGNLYDAVSALARRSVLVQPDTDMGSTYGSTFGPMLQSLRQELTLAMQALQQSQPCME